MESLKKLIVSSFTFIISLCAFYLVFAFITWDIVWVTDDLWVLRFLFSVIGLPISLTISTEFYKNI